MVHRDIATARFNLRECCKQLLLLEDHLSDTAKQCPDCIIKHCLTLEAFIDEGKLLSPNEWEKSVLDDLSRKSQQIQGSIKTGQGLTELRHRIRMMRKMLQSKVW